MMGIREHLLGRLLGSNPATYRGNVVIVSYVVANIALFAVASLATEVADPRYPPEECLCHEPLLDSKIL